MIRVKVIKWSGMNDDRSQTCKITYFDSVSCVRVTDPKTLELDIIDRHGESVATTWVEIGEISTVTIDGVLYIMDEIGHKLKPEEWDE